MRFPVPAHHAVKMQPYGCMRIGMRKGNPWIGKFDLNAEFLAQFASERFGYGLARFDLATGKFPISLEDLAGWTLREQESAIWMFNYSSRNIHYRLLHRMQNSRSGFFARSAGCDPVAPSPVARKMPRDTPASRTTRQRPLQGLIARFCAPASLGDSQLAEPVVDDGKVLILIEGIEGYPKSETFGQ